MKNDLRNARMRFVVAGILALASLSALADSYTWIGAVNADWLTASNWSPADPAFANTVNDVCDVNSGGQPQIKTTGQTFNGRLNIQAGAILSSDSYNFSVTISNLHLIGGKVVMGSADNWSGNIAVDSNSELWSGEGDNNGLSAVFSGSGNLFVTNRQGATRSLSISGTSPGYSGKWTVTGVRPTNFSGNLGTGALKATVGTAVGVNANTTLDWELDLQGGTITSGGSGSAYHHSGTVTLLSAAIIKNTTDYGGKHVYFDGTITGSGRITLSHVTSDRKVILNHANSYSGGTIVNDNQAIANVAGSLGTGNLQVKPGATMEIKVTGVLTPLAGIYLDLSGVSTGKLNLAASTTTTVAVARMGGSGGWLAPVGYTELPAGSYTAATLPGYLVGTGTLLVKPIAPPGTIVMFR
jgi:hypothetical protein